MLGPTGHFVDGQKPQKRAEGFWFRVRFIHFCLSVFYVALFLENHSIFSHEILHSYSWYNIGGQYTQTMPPVYWGPFWGILGSYFNICTYFSRLFVQYSVTKFCSGVLGITLTIANTKIFWNNVPLLKGHFGVFLGLFWHITFTFWEPFKIFCEILYKSSLCSFWGSLHYIVPYHDPPGKP